VLSNVFGTAPLAVGAAHVALREKDAGIVAGSGRALTFGGRPTASVPAGATLVSDPVALTVPDFADLAIDVHLPGDTGAGSSPLTVHNGALQTNYVSQPGNHVGTAVFPVASTTAAWFFLARVEVEPTGPAASVVAFGDSLTDGTASTPNTNNRWPDHLARRLLAGRGVRLGMLNLGIAGNRLLTDGAGVNALARFDRDVLSQTGVSHVVVLEGINDLGLGRPVPPPVEDLIAAHQQLITRARARGLRIYGATMLPFEGTTFPGYWSPENEARRQAFNQWLRTSGAYDAVIDFDTVVRDAAEPTKLAGKFKAADNLHLNDAGYQALAGAVDLALFATHPETAARSR
jgi:lysophospholipase L1-like esterase